MKRIVLAGEMKELDAYTINEVGIPSLVLMERAALALAERILAFLSENKAEHESVFQGSIFCPVLVAAGIGNNGGDGIAIARILHCRGVSVDLLMAGSKNRMTAETQKQLSIARALGVHEVTQAGTKHYSVIVDALFGVGLSRPIEGTYAELIHTLNQADAYRIAVDIPSGVDASTGQELGIAFHAHETVTFAFGKAGLYLYPGKKYAGKVQICEIGIGSTEMVPSRQFLPEERDLSYLRQRMPDGNKGSFGKVLIVAGSPGMCGAAAFAGRGALGSGAGMVKIQTAEENRVALQSLLPEAMLDCSDDPEKWKQDLAWCDSLVIGPGIGTDESACARLRFFLEGAKEKNIPALIDADGLNLLALHPELCSLLVRPQKKHSAFTVLTPHLGEMGRLTGISPSRLALDRGKAAAELALRLGSIIVMKDASTVTASPSGTLYINPNGNSGMATAGSGDALAGILGGILAQAKDTILESEECAQKIATGVFLHGLCGDLAAEEYGETGMTVSDLLSCLQHRVWAAADGQVRSCSKIIRPVR